MTLAYLLSNTTTDSCTVQHRNNYSSQKVCSKCF